ncbi:MAG: zinc ribbon domain-containing protein [Anaerolineales bacterium]|jgi:hypothetical protein|nr:zinc ribbon domain-containing protein [Anaerolineales bacterium]
MRKLFLILILGVFFACPSFASAQSETAFASVNVQLWPEYDQPSMLVIVDFLVAPGTPLPVDLTFRIPQDANLIAVAVQTGDGGFLNAEFNGPQGGGEWQSFTMPITQNAHYRFEYYQPLTFVGNQRLFSYLWDGAFEVDVFQVGVLEPLDTTSLSTTPAHRSIEQINGLTYYDSEVLRLEKGEQYALNLQYEKTSDALLNPPQGIQPVAPVDDNTPGRVSLNNSLPYIIGGLGVVMIAGGVLYYLQAGRSTPSRRSRRHKHSPAISAADDAADDAYCPQCGARSKPGDRFCRTCGARLRIQAE